MSEMWTKEQAEKINKTWVKPCCDSSQVEHIVRFNKEDVVKVAKALLEFGVHSESYGDSYPYDAYECDCCDAHWTPLKEDFRHNVDCPILVAQDLLTRI